MGKMMSLPSMIVGRFIYFMDEEVQRFQILQKNVLLLDMDSLFLLLLEMMGVLYTLVEFLS